MDAWCEVGPTSNLNLKGKIGENMGFSPSFFFLESAVSEEGLS